MNEFRETEMKDEAAEINMQEKEKPENTLLAEISSLSDASRFDKALEKLGFFLETTENSDIDEVKPTKEERYSEVLEKGDNGKYYDKETGKEYGSVGEWEKAQVTLAKRYDSTAEFYESKAKKEWARFKNSEENGESECEKWEHYKTSQECYVKAKEYKEKGKQVWEKLNITRES
ncbi:MAG: hypothetical protein U0H60_02030 [Lachnospiraceae bacterium]|nr:hypothetical protein [Lachnospiraceae bacterium]MEE0282962.1 hypothetical protein [Lachnospiraceae bacterium]